MNRKNIFSEYVLNLYLNKRFYIGCIICAALFVLRFFLPFLGDIPFLAVLIFAILLIYDYLTLFSNKNGIRAERSVTERFSNGDENEVAIHIESFYPFAIRLKVIDEIPFQFQKRDVSFSLVMAKYDKKIIRYQLRPVKRGVYEFGQVQVYAATSYHFFSRRFREGKPVSVPVYPSYLQMRKYRLMAMSNRLSESGLKKVRKLGHSLEFDQIKEYVTGDDYRTINWKATARKNQLMVNDYVDEKSQQIYCIIDKSRIMKMPFDGLSLLDYSINATLVLSNIAIMKGDKAGLLTFSEKPGSFLPADKRHSHMQKIMQALYNQKTRYLESDFEQLYIFIRRKISQRSLIVLFTNFESLGGMERQLPFLKKIAENHLLICVFFENTGITEMIQQPAFDLKEIYTHAVAENIAFEKRQIVKELNRNGIHTIYTAPKNLNVETLNKYLEIKARHLL